uniref:Tail protein n=1 Tax=viral metagenome TaxID=1070528 RepID=A0A6M3K552_9ZZZZ
MGSGREIIAAICKTTPWGTATACGALDGILILREAIKGGPAYEPDDSLQTWPKQGDLGAKTYQGDITANMRYRGLGLFLAMAMGTAGTPAQQGGTTAWLHTLQLATKTDGIFATLAIDKGHSVWEYASCKIAGFTLRGEAGKPVELIAHVICSDLARNTSAGTNNNTTMASVTIPDTQRRALFRQGVFRINSQSGAAIDDDDIIYPNKFEFVFKRKLSMDHVAGSDVIQEPLDDGNPEINLKIGFPKYTADTYLDALVDETYQKMDIKFTGALISGAYYYGLNFYFPNLKCINAEAAVDGAGKIIHPLEFDCLGCDAAPTGMTSLTVPFKAELQNLLTTDILA